MFVLPDNIVRKIINREINYNSIANPKNKKVVNNEIMKGYLFEDQAKVNLSLEEGFTPICKALEEKCRKEKCILYDEGEFGKIKGWVCREYKVDFPDADFDLRYQVVMIGINSVNKKETIKNLKKLEKQGGRYICLGCNDVCQKKRQEIYEDGHGGRMLDMCNCGSDLFIGIREFINS